MSAETVTALRWWFLRLVGVALFCVLLWMHWHGRTVEWYVWMVPAPLMHHRFFELIGLAKPGK